MTSKKISKVHCSSLDRFYHLLSGLVLLSFFFLTSCTKVSSHLFEAPTYVFPGIGGIEIEKNGSLILSWEEVPAESVNYRIYRRKFNDKFNWNSPFQTVSTTSFVQEKYSLSSRFCYAVRYVKLNIESDPNTAEVCPELPYVDSFEGVLSAVPTDTGQVLVSWKIPSEATGIKSFNIYRGDGFSTLAESVGATSSSVVINNLALDETYTFGVRAVDEYGREDENTKAVSVTTVNNTAPVFSGLTTATAVSASSIKLTWLTASGSPKEYKIYMAQGAHNTTPTISSFTTPIASVSAPITTYTVTGLGDDLAYTFIVRAMSSGGQEDTNVATKTVVLSDTGAPVFAGITSASFSAGGAQISWTASTSQVTSYYVYYQLGSGAINYATANLQIVPNTAYPGTQVSSAQISGLQDNQTYSFSVRALDRHSQLDTNTEKRTASSGDLTPPVFLGVTGLVALDDTRLQITFNRSIETDMSRYSIRVRQTSLGGDYTEVKSEPQPSGAPATVTAILTGLIPATSYDVIVKAMDGSGNASTNTAINTRSTLDLTPPTFSGVSNIGQDPADSSKVKVSWTAATDASGVLGYRVFYSTSSLSGCASELRATISHPNTYTGCSSSVLMSALVAAGTNYLSIPALTEGATYYFVVHALDNSTANNEDTNTLQSAYNVPFYTPPATITDAAITGGNGPSATNTITVTGTGATGNTIKVYVNTTYSTQTILNSGTAFSISVVLPTTSGTYSITVSQKNISDVEGNQSTPINYVLLNSAPTATLSGKPCATDGCATAVDALAITVAGANVTTYQFTLLYSPTTISATCAAASYNGTWIAVATNITTSLVGTGDGVYRLCVRGRDAASNSQDAASATQFDFTRDSVPVAAPSTLQLKDSFTNSTTVAYSPTVTATVSAVTGAAKYCVTPTNTAPSITDSCWVASTTLTVTLTGTTGYAWSQTASGAISTSSTSDTITVTNICDSGSLSDTCTISSAKTVNDGDHIGGQGNLVITSAGSITGTAEQRFTITLGGNFTANSGAGNRVFGNMTLNAVNVTINGTISADEKGYQGLAQNAGQPGSSGGALAPSGSASGGGGGHAGAGGIGSVGGAAGGLANASTVPTAPTTFGGSGGGNAVVSGKVPGNGGGAIKIVASGLLTLDGTVTANGGTPATNVGGSGGGAGGSIWLSAGSIAGIGTASVKGGNPAYTSGAGRLGGGGSGGFIYIQSSNAFLGNIELRGGGWRGTFGAGDYFFTGGGFGYPGILKVSYTNPCSSGSLSTTCIISNSIYWGTSQAFSGTGSLVIASGGTLKTAIETQSMSIAMSGDITVENGGSILANLTNVTGNNFTIDTGGIVSANSLGHFGSIFVSTAPAGTTGANGVSAAGGGGGGHGGRGGVGQNSFVASASYTNSPAYGGGIEHGSYTQPTTFGGPGGGNTHSSLCSSSNNNLTLGGGAIKISVTGTLTVNGSLTANGGAGCSNAGTASTSGAAGGALWLNVSTLSGSGTITANGGAGGSGASASYNTGGGGGGRIAIYSTNKFAGTVRANGGDQSGGTATAGAQGTIYYSTQDNYCSSGTLSTTCTISESFSFPDATTLSGSGNLVLASGAKIYTPRTEKSTIAMAGNFTAQSGSTMIGNFTVNAANISLDSGSVVNADGWGYLSVLAANGLGYQVGAGGVTGGAYGSGGGAHGGAGGHGATSGTVNASTGGTAYGSSTTPVLFGSAGASLSSACIGGSGGGAIRLNATGTTTINTNLSAKGLSAGSTCNGNTSAGGGAGGSIYITTATFAGDTSASVNADGGNAFAAGNAGGGGGSGGRISVTRTSTTFSGTMITPAGGTAAGTNAVAGASGTLSVQAP